MSNKYSPIKSILIKNFRNIGEVYLDFTKSPIISLIGENEAGKTSVIKAIAVCVLHAFQRDQKDYIRDNTNGFGVAIELDDTTRVIRMKTDTINRYQVDYPDKTSWDTNKIDAGLPVQVSNIMGFMEEPETKEFLQIRTYEDKLLFVVTTASTNYKVMHNALKIEQIAKAIDIGSKRINGFNGKANTDEIKVETLNSTIRKLCIYSDIEPLKNIRERLKNQIKPLSRLDRGSKLVDDIKSIQKEIGITNELFEKKIEAIDIGVVEKFNKATILKDNIDRLSKLCTEYNNVETIENINETILKYFDNYDEKYNEAVVCKKKLEKVKDIENYDTINEQIVMKMDRVLKLCTEIEQDKMKSSLYDSVFNIEKIEENIISKFNKALILVEKINNEKGLIDKYETLNNLKSIDVENKISKLNKAITLVDNNIALESAINKIGTNIEQINNYLKQNGAAVVVCDKCGEQIVVDVESLNA